MWMNSVAIIGRLGKDAEVTRVGQKDTPLAKFSIALDDGWGDNKKTFWFDVTMWGERAEKIGSWLTKGKVVAITGSLRQETWTNNEGQKRSRVVINARDIDFPVPRNAGVSSPAPEENTDEPPF
jgi:single-strand DNA-binding protein